MTHIFVPAQGGPLDGVQLKEAPPLRDEISVVGGAYVLDAEAMEYRWVDEAERSDEKQKEQKR